MQRQVEDDGPSPQRITEDHERTAYFRLQLTHFQFQQVMIVLYHVEGMAYGEIAETLNLPVGTVKSRLDRARLALRKKLEPSREQYGPVGSSVH